MNKLVTIFIGIGAIVLLAFLALILILDKDVEAYIGSITTLVTLLVTTGLIGRRLDVVSKNVNGNTSKLLEENKALRELVGVGTDTVTTARKPEDVAIPLMSEDTIQRISDDKDRLPSHKA